MIGGLLIRSQRIYKAGEYVTIAEVQGKVRKVGLLYTYLEANVARNLYVIENAIAVTGVIVNHSRIGGSPVTVDIPIYDPGTLSRPEIGKCLTGLLEDWPLRFDDTFQAWLETHDGEAEIWRIMVYIPDHRMDEIGLIAGDLKIQLCDRLESLGVVVRDDDRVDVFIDKGGDEERKD